MDAMLFVLQLAHTVIYLAALVCIAAVWVFALSGRGRRFLLISAVSPVLIGLGLVLNDGDCVFQSWARMLADAETDAWTRDLLFIPEVLAVNTPLVFTPVFVIGLGLAGLRIWSGRGRIR